MEKRSPFRSPSPTAWRSLASGAAVALVAYWLSAGGFGFGSFVVLSLAFFALTLQFSEWRTVKYSALALALGLGILLSSLSLIPTASWIHGGFAAGTAGVLATLLFASAAPHRDPRRTTARVFNVGLTFLTATLLFAAPSLLTFASFVAVLALLMRDEARSWAVLRVGQGKLIGAAVGLLGAEIAAFVGLLPLGPVRAGAFTALALLLAREGLGEAYQGDLRRELVFQGLAVLFALSVLLFASTSWTL